MKIKTKLQILVVSFFCISIFIVVVFYVAFERITIANDQSQFADALARSIIEQRIVSDEFLLYREERALEQWRKKQEEISSLLQTAHVINNSDVTLSLGILAENQESTFQIFTRILEGINSHSTENLNELEKRLVGQLLIKSQSMVAEAFRLSEIAQNEITTIQNIATIAVLVSFILLLLMAYGTLFIFQRSVVRPLHILEQGTVRIADGNLNYHIKISSKDELGALATSFNNMIRRLRETLEALEKDRGNLKLLVESKDNFIALISHQLRTPLTILRGNADLLIRASHNNDTVQNHVAEISDMRSVTLRLIRLVNDILMISKASSETNQYAERERIDLSVVVASILSELQTQSADAHVEFRHVSSPSSPPIAYVNEDAVRQVLSNLIENAIKYSASNTTNGKDAAHVEIRYMEKDDSIEIQVEDTGVGIPHKEQSHVFERFFRASNVAVKIANGNGLGLFLVKLIVDRLGGTIRFTSTENVGTTFYLTLPRS